MGLEVTAEGVRGIFARQFTLAEAERITSALARFLLEKGWVNGVLVGYDTRFMAEDFAERMVSVLAGFLPVFRCPEPVTAPQVAFAVKRWSLSAGILVTASHNPADYQGLKMFTSESAPMPPEEWKAVISEEERGVNLPSSAVFPVEPLSPTEEYLKNLLGQVEEPGRGGRAVRPLKVVFDPLYGSGRNVGLKALQSMGVEISSIHHYRDVLFGGLTPDPTEGNLKELSEAVIKAGADLGVALDGDGDRFGVVDEKGNFIPQNWILGLLAYHLYSRRGLSGPLVRTIATTHFLNSLATAFHQECVETPVGFHYLIQAMKSKNALMGGEENGGFGLRGYLSSSDGLLAHLLLIELLRQESRPLSEILTEVRHTFGKFYSKRLSVHLTIKEQGELMARLREEPVLELLGRPLMEARDLQGVKFVFEGERWFLVRPSTTEPLLRIYMETPEQEELPRMEQKVLTYLGL